MAEIKEGVNYTNTVETKPETNAGLVDVRKDEVDLPAGVETWLRKVENAQVGDVSTVTDDRTGQPVMQPAAPTNPVVQLPISKQAFTQGFGKKIGDAGKWLSTFLFRFIKIKVKKKKALIKFKDDT